jgi:D-3-phosphoglycerate dehydrogenase
MNKKKFKVLITWRLLIDKFFLFKKFFKKNKILYDLLYTEQYLKEIDLLKIIHKYDGLICGDDQITKKVIDKAKRLKVISKWGTGMDSIDLQYAKKKNIKVFNSPGAFTKQVAQHAVALMLCITRNIYLNHQDIQKGIWSKRICSNLDGKTVGIIGFGKIGKEIKRILSVYKIKFLLNDIKKSNINWTTKKKLLKYSDIIFLAVDLNKYSNKLITLKELKVMKSEAILINICRGAVIDNNALIKALKEKMIKAAGLDVFEEEPVRIKSKFLKLDNCILTSHNAFNSEETINIINTKSVRNLIGGLSK